MKKKVILLILLTVMIVGTSNGEQFNYTWKDAKWVLNITDYPPPDGIEIIDIKVIPIQDIKKVAPVVSEQDVPQNQSAVQDRRRQVEAASLGNEAVRLRQEAANIAEEAQELSRIATLQKRNRRLLVLANSNAKKAEELFSQADSLVKRAEDLEYQASQLK